MHIGFIGLGAMGRPMAHNLLAADFTVTVWNRSADKTQPLVDAGAKAADSPAEAAGCDLLISMLADDAAVTAVIDEHDLIHQLPDHGIHVNMATCSIACAKRLAARHDNEYRAYVAAPVLGRPDMAAAAKLHIVAAGDGQAIETARPALEAMGQTVWPAGEAAYRANAIKLATNFMLVSAVEAMGEAASLVESYGIERETFLDVITQSVFAAPAYQGYAPAMKARDYDNPEGFKLGLGAKDLDLALAASHDARVPLPIASAVRERLLEALAAGEAELDLAALAEGSRRAAHLDDGGSRG